MGVALSAAEKRNALRGPLTPSIGELASEALFTRRLPFGNSRYRHFEIACKFLLLTDARAQGEARLPDLKKAYLDDFVIRFRDEGRDERATELLGAARDICARMTEIFV